jgi:tight adherence protein B
MTAISVAAVLLAAATLTAAPRPVERLRISRRRIARPAVWLSAAAAIVIAALLAAPSLVLVCLIATGALVSRLHRQRRRLDRRREGEAMAAALEILVGELKVGAHPMSAFAVAGAESAGPVGRSLRAVAIRARLGADVAEGIRGAAVSSAVPGYWDRLAVCWQLAAEHGLAMSVLMRAAHRDIVDRQLFADRTHAALAGARATATILALLPALGVLLGQLVGANPVGFLLGGGTGGVLLVIGATLICAGVLWADGIVDRLMP